MLTISFPLPDVLLGVMLALTAGALLGRRYRRPVTAGEDAARPQGEEEKYLDLINHFSGVIYSTDPAGVIAFVSSRVLELTGYSAKEVAGRRFSFLVEPSMLPLVNDHYTRQLTSRTRETTLEFQALTREGQTKWVEQIAVLRENDGAVSGFQCFVRDISEKKKLQTELGAAEIRLKEQRLLMQSVIDNANALLYVKDWNGRYLMANRRFFETLALEEKEVIGQTDYSFCPKEQADHYRAIDEKVLTTGEPVAVEETLESAAGNICLLVTKFPLRDHNQRLIGLGGIATDITERAHFQQALVAAREEAEDARKMQEQFLANMSHEIRTPMHGIKGITHLLRDTPLNPQQAEYVQFISRSAENLLVIINDILDFSKIKAGQLLIEHIDYRLIDVLDNVRALFTPLAEKKNLSFAVSIDKAIPEWLQGDPHRLNQVLMSLVGDAIKAAGGDKVGLTVGIQGRRPGQLVLGFAIEGGREAGGMESNAELGLAISRQLLKLQGGDIAEGDQGSPVLRFHLPVGIEPVKPETCTPVFGDFEGTLQGYLFLLAEDNPINQKIAEHALKKAGGEVKIAGDGGEAIRLLERERFDLVIMDLQMPVMDGYRTTRHLRSVLGLDVPVIAMTASAIKGERLRCLEAGMDDYMSKPFEFADFYRHLLRLLGKDPQEQLPVDRRTSTEIFDLSLLLEVGDADYISDIIEAYLESLPGQLVELEAAAEAADHDRLLRIAHRLLGSTAMLKAPGLADRLGRLERLAKEEADGRSLVEELLPRFGELQDSLAAFLLKIKNDL